MGYRSYSLKWVTDTSHRFFDGREDLRMLELGDQEIDDGQVKERSGRDFFRNRGYDFTSFDLNGRLGAIKVDLGVPEETNKWNDSFDILTNIGTLEHVEPSLGQYHGFKNVHRWVRPGGLMFHAMPCANDLRQKRKWIRHCNFFYGKEFFENLARTNDYRLLDLRENDGLIFACLEKTSDVSFIENEDAFLSWITEDRSEGTTDYPGINNGDTLSSVAHLWRETLDRTRRYRKTIGFDRSLFRRLGL